MNSPRRRVLLMTRNLPPLRGGMERLNLHLALELQKTADVAVVGPEGSAAFLERVSWLRTVPIRPLWRFFVSCFAEGIRLARRTRPDIVVAGSGLCAPFAHVAARCIGARSAVYVHGLDLVTRHVIYRALWRPFIRRTDICIANSANTGRLARDIGVPGERIHIVHPGVTLPESLPDAGAKALFRSRHDWEGKRVLLSVGRLTERKGLLEFVRHVLPRLRQVDPRIVLAVVGNDALDALNGQGIRERLDRCIGELGLDDAVLRHGELSEADLASAYACADLAVFPVRAMPGDVEGFGMVAIEAAAHGLPTVAYAVGGVPDAIADGVSGWLVAPDDHAGFASAVLTGLSLDRDVLAQGCRDFARRFQWHRFGEAMVRALGLS